MSSFSATENVVAVFGVPRSGTSWLGQIFNSSPFVAYRFQPLFSYEFKDRLKESSSEQAIKKFYNDLLEARSDFVLQTENISGKTAPIFTKADSSTLVWKEVRYINIIKNLVEKSDTKLVLLTRHPGAVINSWLRAPKEFDVSWDPHGEWRTAAKKNLNKPEEYNGYEKWKEATKMFVELAEKHPKQVTVVKYEDLNKDSLATTQNMFDFVDLELGQQTKDFIQSSKSSNDDDPYGVFRQKQNVDKWRYELDPEIIDEITADLANYLPAKMLGYK